MYIYWYTCVPLRVIPVICAYQPSSEACSISVHTCTMPSISETLRNPHITLCSSDESAIQHIKKHMMQQLECNCMWYSVASSTLPLCAQMRFARHERGGRVQRYTACCCGVTCTPQKSRRRNQGSIFMYGIWF